MPRKQKKYHFVYKTTNLINGRHYIGMHSTDNLNDGYMGSGKLLRRSLNKHGKKAHKLEILEFVKNRIKLKEKEKEIVNINEVAKNECMNLMIGGGGGFVSIENQRHRSICGGTATAKRLKEDANFRKEWLKKVSDCKKGDKNPRFGKKATVGFSGKRHSERTKKKMSESSKGIGIAERNSQFGTCWITKGGVNKKIKRIEIKPWSKNGWGLGRKIK